MSLRRGRVRLSESKLLMAAGLGCALLFAEPGAAQVTSSKHNLSTTGPGIWGSPSITQICIFCHIPHRATEQPLIWNRTNPTQNYQLYPQTDSLQAVPGQPGLASRRCLSCHDGSTAVDAFNQGRAGPPQMMAIGDVYYPGSPWGEGGANIGGNYPANPNVNDLADDHPIGFVYDNALAIADGTLRDPATTGLPLYQQRIECPTCHDVHNTSGGFPYLLRVTPASSTICKSCHIK